MRIAWGIAAPFADHDLLTRSALLSPQAEIDDPSIRATNVAGSFLAHGSTPESVLLVDDVMTTGSTAKEAALCLKNAGTKRVYVACLALGR
jgi:predicted amidophosphoribosyltransferase